MRSLTKQRLIANKRLLFPVLAITIWVQLQTIDCQVRLPGLPCGSARFRSIPPDSGSSRTCSGEGNAVGLRFRLVGVVTVVAALALMPLLAVGQSGEHEFSHPDFVDVWDRTDLPVQQGQVNRTWMWGPGANTPLMDDEPYAEADGGMRSVQYTDKSRMELPVHPVDPDSDWFITQGLLATELMTGELQIGDATFEQHQPADIYVAGDPVNNKSPTYAQMGQLIDRPSRSGEQVITEILTSDGQITDDPLLDMYGVWDQEYVAATDNYIASVFWDFMNSSGTIYQNGQYVTGPVFTNPFYAIGFPITDAYWGDVTVAEQEQEVLIQCFQRRCLTFAPGNDPGWQVESGNIGQHYYDWRYEHIGDPVDDASDDSATDDTPPPVSDDSADDATGDDDPFVPFPDRFETSPELSANVTAGDPFEVTVTVFDQNGHRYEGATVNAWFDYAGEEPIPFEPGDRLTGADGTVTLSHNLLESPLPGSTSAVVEVDRISETHSIYIAVLPPDDDDPIPGPGECVTEGNSIQAAIDAASAGDEVCVEAGVYEENLTIETTGLTLSTENGATLELSESPTNSAGIDVRADDVTVAGFTINEASAQGVRVGDVSGVELLHLDIGTGPDLGIVASHSEDLGIRGTSIDLTGGQFDPNGISLISATDVHMQMLHITGVNIGIGASPLQVGDQRSTGTIEGSLFENYESSAISMRNGVDLEILNNEFSDGPMAVRDLPGDGNTITMIGNEIDGNEMGVWVEDDSVAALQDNLFTGGTTGVRVEAAQTAKIDDNDFIGYETGVMLSGEGNVSIRGNTFEQSEAGVLYGASVNSEIRDNLFYDNGRGVEFFTSSEADIEHNRFEQNKVGIQTNPDADGSLPFVTDNDFIGNGGGIHVEDAPQGSSMFARMNFWGQASGPSGEGPGLGDSISEHVNADYWRDEVINPHLAP